jgi:hypothetical protein
MKNILIILAGILAVLLIVFYYAKNNILNNVSGKFNSFTLTNISGILPTTTDIKINFDIINNSNFGFSVTGFKVKIYNNITGEFLTENSVLQELAIPRGVSTHDTILINNKIAGSLDDMLNSQSEYKAAISFNVFGFPVEFEQLINL